MSDDATPDTEMTPQTATENHSVPMTLDRLYDLIMDDAKTRYKMCDADEELPFSVLVVSEGRITAVAFDGGFTAEQQCTLIAKIVLREKATMFAFTCEIWATEIDAVTGKRGERQSLALVVAYDGETDAYKYSTHEILPSGDTDGGGKVLKLSSEAADAGYMANEGSVLRIPYNAVRQVMHQKGKPTFTACTIAAMALGKETDK